MTITSPGYWRPLNGWASVIGTVLPYQIVKLKLRNRTLRPEAGFERPTIGETILPFLRRTPQQLPAPAISQPVRPRGPVAAAIQNEAGYPAIRLRDPSIIRTERTGL